jgi:HJR/Mrr/RecB family endonuclease
MQTSTSNFEDYNKTKGVIHAIEQRLTSIEDEISSDQRELGLLNSKLWKRRLHLAIRNPEKSFELWPIGVVLVGTAACGVLAVIAMSFFSTLLQMTIGVVFFVGVLASTALIRLMYSPSLPTLTKVITSLELLKGAYEQSILALSERLIKFRTQLNEQYQKLDSLQSSLEIQAEMLLAVNWKAMRDSDWESFLAAIFRMLGAEVTETGTSGDQGVDLVVEFGGMRTAIQAKGYYNAVGNAAVQQAVAGKAMYSCLRCAVITNSRFTKAAQQLAHMNGCMLFDEECIRPLAFGELSSQFMR